MLGTVPARAATRRAGKSALARYFREYPGSGVSAAHSIREQFRSLSEFTLSLPKGRNSLRKVLASRNLFSAVLAPYTLCVVRGALR